MQASDIPHRITYLEYKAGVSFAVKIGTRCGLEASLNCGCASIGSIYISGSGASFSLDLLSVASCSYSFKSYYSPNRETTWITGTFPPTHRTRCVNTSVSLSLAHTRLSEHEASALRLFSNVSAFVGLASLRQRCAEI